MTIEELRQQYWAVQSIDGKKISWTHRSATQLFAQQGLDLRDCDVGTRAFSGHCGRCQTTLEVTVSSRSKAEHLARQAFDNELRCSACKFRDEEDHIEQRRREREEEREREERERQAAQERREERKGALKLKFGELFTGEYCPSCDDGFLLVKLNTNTMKVFASCSSYNPYRSMSCRYTQPIAQELQDKYREIFRTRLVAVRTDSTSVELQKAGVCLHG